MHQKGLSANVMLSIGKRASTSNMTSSPRLSNASATATPQSPGGASPRVSDVALNKRASSTGTTSSLDEKAIGNIVSYLIPHVEDVKSSQSRSLLSYLQSVMLVNKKWYQCLMDQEEDWKKLYDQINQEWNVEDVATTESIPSSRKFIKICK